MRIRYLVLYLNMLLCSCGHNKQSNDYLISSVNIVDVENGNIIPNQYVRISGERIVEISASKITVSASTKNIDGKGKFLIPGLWDMHTHYYWNYKNSNPLLIANGITGIREMFGDMQAIKKIRASAKKNSVFAPEIISSGAIIDGVPAYWPGSDTITDPSRAKDLIEKQVKQGVDFLKVYTGLNRESYFAIAKLANDADIPFAGHIPKDITIWEAMEMKQKSFEHLYGLLEGCTRYPEQLILYKKTSYPYTQKIDFLLRTFDEGKFDSLVQVLAKSDSWICPTLPVLRFMGSIKDNAFTNDARLKYMPSYMTDSWNKFKDYNTAYIKLSEKQFQFQKALVGKMQKAGVKIIAGSDYPNPYCFPGFSLHDELSLMVDGGLTSLEALQTATINPAIFLDRQQDYGTVDINKFASLVLLNKNPLKDINNTKEIYSVFLKGYYFDRSSLNKMLEKAIEN